MPREKTSQKSPLFVLLVFLVLLLVVGIGLRLMKSSSPTTATLPTCQYDPDVCEFFRVLQKKNAPYQGFLTATIISTNSNKIQSQIVIKADKNSNLSIASYKNGGLDGESVLFDNTLYFKNVKTNTWEASPTPPDSSLRDFKDKTIAELNKTGDAASYVFIRGLPCGNLTCMKYQRILSKSDPTKTYILFDTKDHLLREIISTEPDGTTTDTFFTYDSVTIPHPVL